MATSKRRAFGKSDKAAFEKHLAAAVATRARETSMRLNTITQLLARAALRIAEREELTKNPEMPLDRPAKPDALNNN